MRLDDLLASQPLAVLATESGGRPYTNLIAFAADGRARVFFATTRSTRKWNYVTANHAVSVLVDDRTNRELDFHEAAAATGLGSAEVCAGAARTRGLDLLLRRHPHLVDFLTSPSTDILLVRITDWYVVERFQAVTHVDTAGTAPSAELAPSAETAP